MISCRDISTLKSSRRLICLLVSMIMAASSINARSADTSDDDRLKKLEEAVAALQRENRDMKQENKNLKQQVSALQQHLSPSTAPAAPATHPAQPAVAAANGVTSPPRSLTVRESKNPVSAMDLTDNGFVRATPDTSAFGIQIGPVTITPLGFMDFTSVTRSTRNGGDIGTAFASFPYSNTAAAQLSEERFSAKNSRLGLRMDTEIMDTKVTGYFETDFLGNQPTNINVASNSDTMRMRVYFVDVQHGPWEFLAGQDWSMLTPNRKGISPFPSDVFFSQNVDVNYQVGLVWERTPQFRILYHLNDQWTFGISGENPDQYVGPAVKLPAAFTGSSPTQDPTQFDNGSNGTASSNVMPDWIGKVAFDTKIAGLPLHAEAAGLLKEFRVNTFVPGVISSNAEALGYGGSFNMSIGVLPHLQLIENFYASNGGGREISTGVAPDFIVTAPDASGRYHISPVESFAGIAGFEWDVFKPTKLYGYYGQAYIDNQFSQLPAGGFVGYGFPGSSTTNNKRIQEYTLGLTQVLWNSQRYGDLKLMLQYSYLEREPWFVTPGTPSDAHMQMGYVNVRYDLP